MTDAEAREAIVELGWAFAAEDQENVVVTGRDRAGEPETFRRMPSYLKIEKTFGPARRELSSTSYRNLLEQAEAMEARMSAAPPAAVKVITTAGSRKDGSS